MDIDTMEQARKLIEATEGTPALSEARIALALAMFELFTDRFRPALSHS